MPKLRHTEQKHANSASWALLRVISDPSVHLDWTVVAKPISHYGARSEAQLDLELLRKRTLLVGRDIKEHES